MRSWNNLAEETGRRDVSLKSWHELYQQNQDYDKFVGVGKKVESQDETPLLEDLGITGTPLLFWGLAY